jgi:hypothetical protein
MLFFIFAGLHRPPNGPLHLGLSNTAWPGIQLKNSGWRIDENMANKREDEIEVQIFTNSSSHQ